MSAMECSSSEAQPRLSTWPARIFLIGSRGSGKTTVAQRVAARLGWNWTDADELIERRHGKSIGQIFRDEGEPAFRMLESELLHELVRLERHLIATGGGIVLQPANQACLRSQGFTIWLTADPDTLWQRVQLDPTTPGRRPALTVGGRAEIEEVLRRREPLYRACAHATVSTVERTPEKVADAILALLPLSTPDLPSA